MPANIKLTSTKQLELLRSYIDRIAENNPEFCGELVFDEDSQELIITVPYRFMNIILEDADTQTN